MPSFLDDPQEHGLALRGQYDGESRCQHCAASLRRLSRQAPRAAFPLVRNMPDLQPATFPGLPVVTFFSPPDQVRPARLGRHLGGAGEPCLQVAVGNVPGSAAHRSGNIQSLSCQDGAWFLSRGNGVLFPQACQGRKGELGRDRGSAPGISTAAVAGPLQMAQGVMPPTAGPQGPSGAASFLTRAAQKLSLSSKRKKHHSQDPSALTTNFSAVLRRAPPPMPPCLLRARSKVKENPGMGKVKVMVRVCPAQQPRGAPQCSSFLKADPRKKQLTLCDPSGPGPERAPASAPKTFAFDAVFTQDASQAEVCAGTVAEVLQSVVNGADGCVFCFGHVGLGKTYTMMGSDSSSHTLGVAPCAISWLYRLVEEHRERTGRRDENLRDLLRAASGNSHAPALYLNEDPVCGSQLHNQSELGAASPEQAASLLDEALAARSSSRDSQEEDRRYSHMLFTLHLYQQHLDQGQGAALSGRRSRLHLIDLGSCEPITSKGHRGGGSHRLTLSALGNVILALTSGAKNVPYRDSKLTMLLRESLGNINCRTTMIAHVSESAADYAETLSTIQQASRVHRMRKKKSKHTSGSAGGDTTWDEAPRPGDLSTQPCDAVIYVGPGGASVCEHILGVSETPPTSVPIIPSLDRKRMRDGHHSDGDHFKCNTFAELQEWLDCVGSGEGGRGSAQAPGAVGGAAKPTDRVSLSIQTATPSPKSGSSHKRPSHSTLATYPAASTCPVSATDCYKWPDPTPESLGGAGEDMEKASFCDRRPGVFIQSGSLGKSHSLKSAAPPSQQEAPQRHLRTSEGNLACRAPPVGMSHQGEPRSTSSPGSHAHSGASGEMRPPRGQHFDRDVLTTTVTLQRPVELNGEDELVFTLVEELSVGGLVDDVTRFHTNHHHSPQPTPINPSRVAIVSSINDEFDAYTSQTSLSGLDSERGQSQNTRLEVPVLPDFPAMLHEVSSLKKGTPMSSNNGTSVSCNKLSPGKYPPAFESTKAPSRVYKNVKANSLNTFPCPQTPQACSTLPRNIKPTSSIAQSNSSSYEQLRPKGKSVDPWQRTNSQSDCRAVESGSSGRVSRNGTRRPGGYSNSVPRPPKPLGNPQRVVDGCERSHEAPRKMPMLRRGATTLGIVPVIHSSTYAKQNQDGLLATGSLKFSSSGKKASGLSGASPKPWGTTPTPTSPIQRANLDPKARNDFSPSALKSAECGASALEMEFDMRFRGYSSGHRTSSLKADSSSGKSKSGLKSRKPKGNAGQCYSSLTSLERSDSLTSVGSKLGLSRENSDASLGSRGRSSRQGSKPGSPASASTSSSPCTTPRTAAKQGQVPGSVAPNGNQGRITFSGSFQPHGSSTVCAVAPAPRNVSLPPITLPPSPLGASGKPERGTFLGTKQATRVTNSRVSELATGRTGKHLRFSEDTDGPGDVIEDETLPPMPPSPYSKVTAPRRPSRYSSGHCSDNSSVLSGELPPAMGRTALFYHSGGSSGYESMIRDSEATGSTSTTSTSTSSARDSLSESGGASSSCRTRVSRSPKKRANGYPRRRLVPAPMPEASPLGKKAPPMGQWVDLLPLPGTLKEPFEIKVYEIDNVGHPQQQRPGGTSERPFQDIEKGLLFFNARQKMLERRQQQIRDLRVKHERLKGELEEVKNRLMLDPRKWIGEFEVDPDLDKESQEYLEALAQVTGELEYCVNLCKSRVMMETCFDIEVNSRAQGGFRELQV
ncbi:hypothetical protein AGOR_G00088390 [Albula goreensis]|uniref:Kinesin motor domain-containing protein n=1 Tax=Albula goreensis TaxID=1534307 RepID=A0A8T3DQ10_9TELE|nr:hypothetical protein AGOR_G00088390 [Albula goreensis]